MSSKKKVVANMDAAGVFDAQAISDLDIQNAIRDQGCLIVKNVLPEDYIRRAIPELERAIQKDAEWHKSRNYSDYGMVMLCPVYEGIFWELLDNKNLMKPFEAILGEGCIVYAYTSSSMPPLKGNYSTRVHVDCPRVIPNYVTNMGATILLSDFTVDNGGTYYLPGSQQRIEPPSEMEFFEKSKRVIAPAGSVFFFNARIWHMGGENKTNLWRHALTINMCRSFMRQRFDFPRALSSYDTTKLSEKGKQKLGFYVQTPASLEEYYAPEHLRKFRQKTE